MKKLINRGYAYYKQGLYDQACSDFKKACELGSCGNYDSAKQVGICK
jgi:hypothetical protein